MNWKLTADRPVYLQLVEQMQQAIAAGTLAPGERLPGVRDLAAEAAVNPNTMQRALQELEAQGLVNTQRTAGRTVTADESRICAAREAMARTRVKEFLQGMTQLGCGKGEIRALLQAAQEEEK